MRCIWWKEKKRVNKRRNILSNVNKRAAKSMMWLIIVGVFSSVSNLAITTFLGRMSASILGQYSLIMSFLSLSGTIVCMGGSVVLSRFIIREKETINRTRIFVAYIYLTIMVLIIFGVILFLFPQLYELFVGETSFSIKLLGIIGVMPIYTAVTVTSYFLMAVLESKISKIMGSMYTFGMAIVIVVLYFVAPQFLDKYFIIITLVGVISTNIVALFIGWRYIFKNGLMIFNKESFNPLVPQGAVKLAICTLGQSVLLYLYQNADKVFLSHLKGLGQLGYYQAILQVIMVIEFVPNMLNNVAIPLFAAKIGMEETVEVKKTYLKIEKVLIFFIATLVFGFIAISSPILQIFGKEYVVYNNALIIMLAGKILTARGHLTTSMLVNLDKNALRLLNSIIQVVLQTLIMVFLVVKIGIYGAVIAKTLTAIIAQILPQYVMKKSEYKIGISKQYIVSTIIVIILSLVIILCDLSVVNTFIISVVAYLMFLIFAGYSVKDLQGILKMLSITKGK